ncbi:hypothetical protein LDZ95_33395 [Pseudomonas aeruginosa]|nr:hypothetical protein [Pseudomonas aeruginosa]
MVAWFTYWLNQHNK